MHTLQGWPAVETWKANRANYKPDSLRISLVPRPFSIPVFDCMHIISKIPAILHSTISTPRIFQYLKYRGKAWEIWSHAVTSGTAVSVDLAK